HAPERRVVVALLDLLLELLEHLAGPPLVLPRKPLRVERRRGGDAEREKKGGGEQRRPQRAAQGGPRRGPRARVHRQGVRVYVAGRSNAGRAERSGRRGPGSAGTDGAADVPWHGNTRFARLFRRRA